MVMALLLPPLLWPAAAALVSKQFPQYTALQVAEQLRITADDIYQKPSNSPFQERLGTGRVKFIPGFNRNKYQIGPEYK